MGFGLGGIGKIGKKISKGIKKVGEGIWDASDDLEEGLGLKPPKIDIPKPIEPTIMPVGDEEERRRQRKRTIAQQAARSGRASTILTGGDRETLG